MKYQCLIFVLLALNCLNATAQYRMVSGQIYRIDDPRVWRSFGDLKVMRIMEDGSLVVQEVFQHSKVEQIGGGGAYAANSSSYTTPGQMFILLNYHPYQAPYPGMNIGFVKAMLVPAKRTTYDVGTPWYPPQVVLTPAQIAAKKAAAVSNIVVNLKVESTNGDAVGQCELGERYMKGDGLAQDQITGQMWLKKSADQGDIEASNYLANFTLTNTATAQK